MVPGSKDSLSILHRESLDEVHKQHWEKGVELGSSLTIGPKESCFFLLSFWPNESFISFCSVAQLNGEVEGRSNLAYL